jgi:hypothetical protein
MYSVHRAIPVLTFELQLKWHIHFGYTAVPSDLHGCMLLNEKYLGSC